MANRVARAMPRISAVKISRAQLSAACRRGFTLLELMIAITIVAFVVAAVLPHLDSRNNEIRSTIRHLAVLSRELRFRAKLQNATYRLVIDMEKNSKGQTVDSYWVERASGNILNDYNPRSPPKNPAQMAAAQKEAKDNDEIIPQSRFTMAHGIMRKPIVLPDGLVFDSVELENLNDPVTKGVVYIYFLPSGFADESAIHISYGKHLHWTLITLPFTGRMVILPEKRMLKNLGNAI